MKKKGVKKEIPYHIRRHHASKGGKIRNLLDPAHAHNMRMQFKGTRNQPIEYYRDRLIARLRERFPKLPAKVHDKLDRFMKRGWKDPRENQREYLRRRREREGVTKEMVMEKINKLKENAKRKKKQNGRAK